MTATSATRERPALRPVVGGRRVAAAREWRWRTFPVYCTFALTFFLTTLAMQLIHASRGGAALLVLAAVALGLALAHLVTVGLVFPRLKPPAER